MALNIVSLIGQYLTPDIVGKVAGMLGGNTGLAQKALGAAVPSVLAGLLGSASKPDGAEALTRAVASQDPGLLDNIGAMLSGDAGGLSKMGGDALNSIIGGANTGALAKALQGYAGIPEGASGQLVGAVGALALGAIGKEAKSQNLDAKGTLSMLMGQKDNIARMLPADFASKLSGTGLFDGISDKTDVVGAAASSTAARATAPVRPAVETIQRSTAPVSRELPKAGTPWWYYALPLALLALLGWWFLGRPAPVDEVVVEEEVVAPAETAVAPAETAEPAAAPAETAEPAAAPAETAEPAAAPAETTETAAAPAEGLTIDGVDVGATVTSAFTQLTDSLKGITDAATAETALPKLTEVRDNLVKLDAPLAGASDTVKTGLKGLVAASLPALTTAADAALGNSAVKGVIGPVLEEIMAKLKAFAA